MGGKGFLEVNGLKFNERTALKGTSTTVVPEPSEHTHLGKDGNPGEPGLKFNERPAPKVRCSVQCAQGVMQKVRAMGTSTEEDYQHCSKKCCKTTGCVAFNYDSKSKSCAL